jgi:hypothetical protein
METDTLEETRTELAPDIKEQTTGANQQVDWKNYPGPSSSLTTRKTQAELDWAAWRSFAPAQQSNDPAKIESAKTSLARYQQYRKSRGEKAFQYLPAKMRQMEMEAARERVGFFHGVFSGPDRMLEAFPEDQRQGLADHFSQSMDPAKDKKLAANLLLAESLTGQPADKLQSAWPGFRQQIAEQVFEAQGEVDDDRFYGLANTYFVKQKAEQDLMKQVAEKASVEAIRGRPLAETMAEAKGLVSEDEGWDRYSPAARAAHAAILTEFSDEELELGRAGFEIAAAQENVDAEQIADSPEFYQKWGKLDADSKVKVLGLMAMQAEKEGEDVEGWLNGIALNFNKGFLPMGRGVQAAGAEGDIYKLEQILTAGVVPKDNSPLSPIEPERLHAWLYSQKDAPDRPMEKQEREFYQAALDQAKGFRDFTQEITAMGPQVKRYAKRYQDGVRGFTETMVMGMAQSAPYMMTVASPYGLGLPVAIQSYASQEAGRLRVEQPGMTEDAIRRQSMIVGLGQAGVEKLQVMTLGAKMARTSAFLKTKGIGGSIADTALKTAIVTGAEQVQEHIQNITPEFTQELAAVLSEDIAGPDWRAVLEREKDAMGDIFAVSLGFGIIGATGSTITDYFNADAIKAQLQDRQGLALAGYSKEQVEEIATTAETSPAAAADLLKAAQLETTPEERLRNSEREVEMFQREMEELEYEQARAELPVMGRNEDGSYFVEYPDGTQNPAQSREDAVQAIQTWDMDAQIAMSEANRELAKFIEESHEGSREFSAKFKFTGREVTMKSWAGASSKKLEIARNRVRIAMRQEFADGLRESDGSEIGDADLPLGAYLILGDSKNFGGAVVRAAMQIHEQGHVGTVVEEHAEGVAKWAMSSGRMGREEIVRNIRKIEQATGKETLKDHTDDQQVIEAFSRLAVANFFGKLPAVTGLSAKFQAILKAFKEAFSANLELAAGIRAIQASGEMDANFEELLDIAGGVSMEYRKANLDREMEREWMESAREGMPEIQETLKGRLPHPETIKAEGGPFLGEVRRIYDGIRSSHGHKATGTRLANEFFLPQGEMADIDRLLEVTNEAGFDFETPAEMLEALDLSLNYGKAQYGVDAQAGTFSIGRIDPNQPGGAGNTGDAASPSSVVTPEMDAAYLAAVKSGDMETAQTMVEAAAKAAGYHTRAMHGTADKFDSFSKREGGRMTQAKSAKEAFFFTDDDRTANSYAVYAAEEGPVKAALDRADAAEARGDWDGYDAATHFAVFRPSQIKSADPVTYDADGNVIPLSERFNPQDDRITYSIARSDSPLLAAIEGMRRAPEAKAEVYAKMAKRVKEVRARFEAKRFKRGFDEADFDDARLEQMRDIATLEAIAKALPPALQGKLLRSLRKMNELTTSKGRENYILKLLPKIEGALEQHLQGLYREAIRTTLKKGAVTVSDAKNRGGKIGAAGHAIFDQARAAMTLTAEAAEADGAKLTEEIEGAGTLSMEQLDELDGKRAALELFYDYENADSARLEQGLELLKNVYSEGRAQWLAVLMERKELRTARVAKFIEGVGYTGARAERTRGQRQEEKLLTAAAEGFMEFGISGSQTIRRLGELTEDAAVKGLTEEMEMDLLRAEMTELEMNLADQRAFGDAMKSILNVSTEYALTKKLREYSEAKDGDAPVTTLEGRKVESITVPIKYVEALVNQEISGFEKTNGERVELSMAQRKKLEEEFERFQEMDEADRKRQRALAVETVTATGDRRSKGPMTKLEALNLYLIMRQVDQREKLEGMGYDETTFEELIAYAGPELIDLGHWMTDYLVGDQDAVNALHRMEKGVGLNMVENYFPVRNDVSRSENVGLSLDGGGPQQAGRSAGFIKERVTNRAEPANVDALSVFLAHRAQVNFWKSHVAPIREWGGVIKDERFSAAIKATMGDTYYGALARRFQRIESGGRLKAGRQMKFDRMVRGLMRRFSMGVLGLRLSTLMVNASAVMNPGLEIPARDLIKGMALAMKRPGAFKDAWNSPAIRRRLEAGATYEAQVAKSSGPDRKPLVRALESVAVKAVEPINYVDTGANTLGAAAIWEYTRTKAADAGLDAEQAKEQANEAVERFFMRAAQPTSRLARSEAELMAVDSPLGALFSLFLSEARKNVAIMFMAARELSTGKGFQGKGMAAQTLFVSAVGMIAVEHTLRTIYDAVFKAEDDEEDAAFDRIWNRMSDAKAWTHRLATSHISGLPLIGSAWQSLTAAITNHMDFIPGEDRFIFSGSNNPLERAALKGAKGAADLVADPTDADAAIDAMQAFGAGIPGMPIFSQLANVAETGKGYGDSNVTEEGKISRFKGRFSSFNRELQEVHGNTTVDGTLNREVQAAKWAAQADWLINELAAMPADRQAQAFEAVDVPEVVRKKVGEVINQPVD